MKYSTVAVTLAAFAVGVVAQNFSDLPDCPKECILGGTAKTSCSIVDIPCSCRDLSYQAQLAKCMANCKPEDAAKGAQVGSEICKAAGVEITIPSITSTVSVPAATTISSSSASSVAPSTTTAAAPTETPETPETPVDDDEEETDGTTTAVVLVPTTTLIASTISAAPAPTGNTTTNGTVTPPVATATPPAQEDSGAGQVAIGSLLGVAFMGAVAFAL